MSAALSTRSHRWHVRCIDNTVVCGGSDGPPSSLSSRMTRRQPARSIASRVAIVPDAPLAQAAGIGGRPSASIWNNRCGLGMSSSSDRRGRAAVHPGSRRPRRSRQSRATARSGRRARTHNSRSTADSDADVAVCSEDAVRLCAGQSAPAPLRRQRAHAEHPRPPQGHPSHARKRQRTIALGIDLVSVIGLQRFARDDDARRGGRHITVRKLVELSMSKGLPRSTGIHTCDAKAGSSRVQYWGCATREFATLPERTPASCRQARLGSESQSTNCRIPRRRWLLLSVCSRAISTPGSRDSTPIRSVRQVLKGTDSRSVDDPDFFVRIEFAPMPEARSFGKVRGSDVCEFEPDSSPTVIELADQTSY